MTYPPDADPTEPTEPDAQGFATTAYERGEACPDCAHPLSEHTERGDTDGMVSCTACAAVGLICDVRLEAWTDEADAELAEAMHDVIHRHADQWSRALETAELDRWDAIERAHLTDDELATAAALFGIVADRDALPLNATGAEAEAALQAGRIPGDTRQPGNNLGAYLRLAEVIARQRETGQVWANARRHYRNRELAGISEEWSNDILAGRALPFPESRDRGDHDQAETHPSRMSSWPIVVSATRHVTAWGVLTPDGLYASHALSQCDEACRR